MKAIYFDHENPEKGYRAVDIEDRLMTYSKLLHCDLIDITMRAISALNPYDRECVLVGSLLIVSGEVDEEGGILGLEDEEIEEVELMKVIKETGKILIVGAGLNLPFWLYMAGVL